MKNRAKISKTYNYLFRSAIFILTYGFIYHEIFYTKDLHSALAFIKDPAGKKEFSQQLGIVIILMLANWSIESFKWKYLIKKIENVSFIKSFEAVMTGISISTFTPNRTGEYLGRVFILERASRIEGALITFLGSLSQLLITILAGTVSLFLCIPLIFGQSIVFSGYLYYGLLILISAFCISLLLLYFNISFLSALREKILRYRLKKYRRFFRVFALFRFRELFITVLLSLGRYLIFSFQYFLLLKMFSVPVPLAHALILVSLVFFLVTVFPTIALTELGIRGTVAIYLFGLYFSKKGVYTDYNIGVVSASTLLWIINLAIPAIAGTFFVFRLKFFRKNNGEGYTGKS